MRSMRATPNPAFERDASKAACTGPDNLASQRAFARAGFRRDREFDDVPNGLHVLMVHHRQEGQVA